MPHLTNDRGTLILKRKFRGVSPIRRATGTADPAVVAQIDVMLHALYQQGRLDVLEAIALGRLHPLKALSQWREGEELLLPAAALMGTLTETWLAWEEKVPGDDHRSSIGTTRRALRIPSDARIDALPDLLAALFARQQTKARSANIARAHVRAFLRDTVGTSSSVYARVKDMRPLRRKARERGTPHPLPTILGLVSKLNEIQAGVGDMAWAMACSGMGNKEYWNDGFDVQADRVQILGQKREQRTREVPRWSDAPLVKPLCWEGRFRDLLRTASDGQVAIYDLRRSFARWCEEAGIIESNRDAYLGHGPKTITQLYTFGQLPGQLAHDAQLLQAYADRSLSSDSGKRAQA